ncbi:helix-turn-helix domain-containing protein [Acetivibrio mesophilus]|uniref:XRE family transcriptional regulator n=1 Tax=Acetivibrio mesophilus TaxID=2487273 RepID=A0A4Q0I3F1_9FIRM|nr:helix-turn-helix transcriptional regulator [Acetivibrio mesophilus]ODM27183.1 transcriptional regulator [Clostridium sp. Bc-iso-3]RXE58783.1 XRE family transcriptional regulator [Acetivibrio mesophilus]
MSSNLGELFKEIRLSKKWSIRQAAKKMGISYSYLSILERGVDPRTGKDSNPKPETLRIISKAYNYPYEELMKAAGYLSDDVLLQKKFDHSVFVKNISLVMGNMTIEEFSDDIYQKTGYQIKSSQIKSYIDGDIEPFPGTINILSKYAHVTPDFWYVPNTEKSLHKERTKYNETILKSASQSFDKEFAIFCNLHNDIKSFLSSEENIPYIKVAMEARKKNISANTLKLLIDTIVNELKNSK